MRRPLPPPLLLCALAAIGCAASPGGDGRSDAQRRSLWDALTGEEESKLGGDPIQTPPPPPRPEVEVAAERLLERLRRAEPGEDRALAAAELVAQGERARPALREALAREEVLIDLVRDLLARVGGGAQADEPTKAARERRAAWVLEPYRLALDRFTAGDHYGALRLIDAILAIEPDTHLQPELRRLRRRAQDEALRASVLSAELRLGAEVLTPGQRLNGRVELHNRSEQPIVLRMQERPGAFGLITIDFEELLPGGARTRIRTQRAVELPRGALTLQPGERHTLRVDLPSPHEQLQPGTVGRYRLGGRLRAGTMLVGDTPYSVFLPLLPREVLAVPGEDRPLTRAPAARFDEAVAAASQGTLAERREPARQAFVAALLMAHRERQEALAAVAQALGEAEGPLSDALCAALARITGEPLNFTREEWLLWWAGQAARPSGGAR